MPRKATKDTYGYEDIAGVEVRRIVRAGQNVPDHYRLEDDSAAEQPDETGDENASGDDVPEPGDDYETRSPPWTVKDLEDEIRARGLEVPANARKPDLIDTLRADDAEFHE
jgi:hypothetical protein